MAKDDKSGSARPQTCKCCKAPLGVDAGELAFVVNDDPLGDPTGAEYWCPQDFVWVRMPAEPGRWSNVTMRAAPCPFCKCRVVDTGTGQCNACGGHLNPIALGPKPLPA